MSLHSTKSGRLGQGVGGTFGATGPQAITFESLESLQTTETDSGRRSSSNGCRLSLARHVSLR